MPDDNSAAFRIMNIATAVPEQPVSYHSTRNKEETRRNISRQLTVQSALDLKPKEVIRLTGDFMKNAF